VKGIHGSSTLGPELCHRVRPSTPTVKYSKASPIRIKALRIYWLGFPKKIKNMEAGGVKNALITLKYL